MEASRIEVCAKMPVKPALWRCAAPALKLLEIFSLATNTKKLFDHLLKTPTFPDSYVRSPTYGTALRLCQGVAQIKVLSSVFRSMNYLLNCIRSLFLLEKTMHHRFCSQHWPTQPKKLDEVGDMEP